MSRGKGSKTGSTEQGGLAHWWATLINQGHRTIHCRYDPSLLIQWWALLCPNYFKGFHREGFNLTLADKGTQIILCFPLQITHRGMWCQERQMISALIICWPQIVGKYCKRLKQTKRLPSKVLSALFRTQPSYYLILRCLCFSPSLIYSAIL